MDVVLVRKRRLIKRNVLAIKGTVEKLSLNPVDESHLLVLEQYLVEIDRLNADFLVIQNQLTDSAEDVDESDILKEGLEFQNGYVQCRAKIQGVLKQGRSGEESNRSILNTTGLELEYNKLQSQIRLPEVDVPIFTGNLADWMEFEDIYSNIIHNNNQLTDVQRLYYLKKFVKGEAGKLIQDFDVTDKNYKEAWALLKKRFANRRLLIENQLSILFGLKPISSPVHLRSLLDNFGKSLRALGALGEKVLGWDTLICYLLVSRIDVESRQYWELSIKNNDVYPSYAQLEEFLETRALVFSHYRRADDKVPSKSLPYKSKTSSFVSSELHCILCKESHRLSQCRKFLSLNPRKRFRIVKENRLCINCLSVAHSLIKCGSRNRCRTCGKSHNSLLHFENNKSEESASSHNDTHVEMNSQNKSSFAPGGDFRNPSESVIETSGIISNVAAHKVNQNTILLSTAVASIRDKCGNFKRVRLLLDNASQSNFISSRFAKLLGLPFQKQFVSIGGIAGTTTSSNLMVTFDLKSLYNDKIISMSAIVLDIITSTMPAISFDLESKEWDYIKNRFLADPEFNITNHVDLLIGAEYFFSLILPEFVPGPTGYPSLQMSQFGWLLSGTVACSSQLNRSLCNVSLQEQLKCFWEIEEVTNKKALSKEEKFCESYYKETTTRQPNGRYMVRLPFFSDIRQLGDSYSTALQRLSQIERRFHKSADFTQSYNSFLKEYQDLGHMSLVENLKRTKYILPHHAVFKIENSVPRIRIVFDATASPSQGKALNSVLATGPTIQDDLFILILRFRFHQFAVVGDIQKMYRQVLVHPEDRGYQHILWRTASDEAISRFELNTITYGTTSAPFLATRTLLQLSEDVQESLPLASFELEHNFYMDDFISGSSSLIQTIEMQKQLRAALESAGMHICKWASNDAHALEGIPDKDKQIKSHVEFSDPISVNTLGLKWCPIDDTLSFMSNLNEETSIFTKRIILSDVSKAFDPLGLLSPIIIRAKILLQKLWFMSFDWDQQLIDPVTIESWKSIRRDLQHIDKIRTPRKVLENDTSFDIHGFCDASEQAYSAAIYIRSVHGTSTPLQLLCAKTRVAPLKSISLPRLELCGALLLSTLLSKISSKLRFPPAKTYLWTDSSIVLCWLAKAPSHWTTFVANRVSQIQELTDGLSWNHIRSEDNPADVATRGLSLEELSMSKLWWFGPEWLNLDPENWQISKLKQVDDALEARKIKTHAIIIDNSFDIFKKYSCYNRLLRITAWITRFSHNCKTLAVNRNSGILGVSEINDALYTLVRIVQTYHYGNDIAKLKMEKCVERTSSLLPLHPFLDQESILRVGGRLANSNLVFDHKHPMILPVKHVFSTMIIRYYHLKYLHAGLSLTSSLIRRQFWLVGNFRNAVKLVLRNCAVCRRFSAEVHTPLMGDLPSPRVTISRPFHSTGLDFAGPMLIRQSFGRSKINIKSYVAVFICLATKAIHLELVLGLSTQAFIAALRRFISRRGIPSKLYCDNATNFVGAKREIDEIYDLLQRESSSIDKVLIENCISWHFIPPRSPHMGGIWEAAVKAMKFHLRRTIGQQILNYEEFYTVLVQIESCLNSRPLVPLLSDASDLDPLTPGHFLIGQPLVALPDLEAVQPSPINYLKCWNLVQRMVKHFWHRWSLEYLHTLQQRPKWKLKVQNLQVNDMVLIREDNQAPLNWLIGRVHQLIPGTDGQVRVVAVRTKRGIIRRPVIKLIPL